MNSIIRLVGISGSLRSQSYNTMLLSNLKELLPDGVELETLSIAALPFYNGDLDIPQVTERPPAVVAFRNAIAKADGLVIVSPEYNYSIPGVLKNAIDWASRGDDSPLLKKHVALMGVSNGQWGTVRMQIAFQAVFLALGITEATPEIMVANGKDKFDATGKLNEEKTAQLITKQLTVLKEALSK
jgi:chromate reductase